MLLVNPRPRFVAFAIAAALCSGVSAQVERSPCAVANADEILRNSGASKAAQERLIAEFAPQFAALEPLVSERNRLERQWLDAKQARQPDDEVNSLKLQQEKAASAEREAAKPLQKALERRKQEELGTLIQSVNDIYKRLGTEQGFKLLLQTGEQEPVFVLDKGFRRSNCKGEVDLTSEIIRVLDRKEASKL